ncbi:hypothetical protein [Methanobrevibacter sp.]|uniref:hypothetical protein n=1 Tax=Methanobrevibacter sp. TaxID=66852 RepID=UPI00388F728F
MSGYISSPIIQNDVNNQSEIIDNLGENKKLTDLTVIAYAYRTNGTLKWVDILDANGNTIRCNCVTVEDVIYIDWYGQYVWTDINCKTLQAGGKLYEEVVEDIENIKTKNLIVDLNSNSSATIGDDEDPIKIGIEVPASTVDITVGLAENAERVLIENETNNQVDIVGSLINEQTPFKHLKKSTLVFDTASKTLFNGDEYFLTQSQSARYLTSDNQGNPFSSLTSLQNDNKYFNGLVTAPGLNDYAIVLDQSNNTAQRYVFTGSQWAFQYNINTTTFSTDQWDAINSKATQNKISRTLLSVCEIQQGPNSSTIELHDINGNVYTEPPQFSDVRLVCYSSINIIGGALKWGAFNVVDVNGNNVTSINKGAIFCMHYSPLTGVKLYKEHFINGDRVLFSDNTSESGMSESNITIDQLNCLANIRSNIQQQFDKNYTFIVYNQATLNLFISDTITYDFSRTLIKAGNYTWDSTYSISNKNYRITGEDNTFINITVQHSSGSLSVISSNSFITFENINFTYNLTGTTNTRLFTRCQLVNCNLDITTTKTVTQDSSNGGALYNCDLFGCTVTMTGGYRFIEGRYGDRMHGRNYNCKFVIKNAELFSVPFINMLTTQTVLFDNCTLQLNYALSDHFVTPVFATTTQNSLLCFRNCTIIISAGTTYGLVFKFGDAVLLNNIILTNSSVELMKGTSAIVANNMKNRTLLWS